MANLPQMHCRYVFVYGLYAGKNDRMEIGQLIRTVRESQDLSAEQLALSLGVETSTVTRAERGERRLTTCLLERIASALGTSVTDLYAAIEGREVSPMSGRDVRMIEVENTLLMLRRVLIDLTPENQSLVVEIAKTVARQSQG